MELTFTIRPPSFGKRAARVVDENIHSAERADCLVEECPDLRLSRHVGLERYSPATFFLDTRNHLRSLLRAVEVIDHNGGAVSRQALGRRCSDAPTSAGHDCYLTLQHLFHPKSP
jgi:hypothetical protein